MVYTITLNPSLDYNVSVKDFAIGKVNRACEECIKAGGKGINVAIVLHSLGCECKALGFLAGFSGEKLFSLLEEKGLDADFCKVDVGTTRINFKLHNIEDSGKIFKVLSKEETEINGIGPTVNNNEMDLLLDKLANVNSEDYIVLGGSIPNGLDTNIYKKIISVIKETKAKIIVDATKNLLLDTLEEQPYLIKPNNYELEEIFSKKLETNEEIVDCAFRLQEKGARNVLVSMAGKGALYIDENKNVFLGAAPKGILHNSVGAGDSMVAGFIYGEINNYNIEDKLKFSITAGSASAFSEELATKNDIIKLYESTPDITRLEY